MDVGKLNLISDKIEVTPGYDLSQRVPSIRLFFSRDGRLFLLGRVERDGELLWSTPFGCGYGPGIPPASFARDVAGFPAVLKERCRFREANGRYAPVLRYCLEVLRGGGGSDLYYTQVEDMVEMLRRESYLLLSDHEEIRGLYLEIQETVSTLYNRYQSAVR